MLYYLRNFVVYCFFCQTCTDYRLKLYVLLLFHEGGHYHIETSPSICSANQSTVFYMKRTSVLKRLISFPFLYLSTNPSCSTFDASITYKANIAKGDSVDWLLSSVIIYDSIYCLIQKCTSFWIVFEI